MGSLLMICACAIAIGNPLRHKPPEVVNVVDIIELNHKYDDNGKLTFSQLIFWRWDVVDRMFHVASWRMVDEHHYVRRQGMGFEDREVRDLLHGVVITRAHSYRETWTHYDPELEDKKLFPDDRRRWNTIIIVHERELPAPGS